MHVYQSDEGEITTSRDVYAKHRDGAWNGLFDGVEVGSSMDHDLTFADSAGDERVLTYLGRVEGHVGQMSPEEREQRVREVVEQSTIDRWVELRGREWAEANRENILAQTHLTGWL